MVLLGSCRRLAAAALVVAITFGAGSGPAHAVEPEWNVAKVGGPLPAAGATVAIVDTGVDASHPTFGGRVLPAIDLVGGAGGDPHGHGTHVAGIVGGGAAGPIIGVAPGAQILPVRVLGADGSGGLGTIAEGIRRAADAGAAVINLSLSDGIVIRNLFGSALSDSIYYAWSKGAICVLAAGNDGGLLGLLLGSGYRNLPAMVVTATGSDDRLAGYANTVGGAQWGLSAPGHVTSSWPSGQYGQMAGTSMAAPHVSGALAVLRAHGLSAQEAVGRLLGTARSLGAKSTYGAGMVDLAAATQGMAINGGTAPPPPAPPPPAPEPTEPDPAAAPDASGTTRPPSTRSSTTTTVPTSTAPDTTPPPSDVVLPRTQAAAPVLPQGDPAVDDSVPLPLTATASVAALVVWVAAVRQLRSSRRISLGRM